MFNHVTPYSLRLHASALYPPNRERCRTLLYNAASELERTRADLAKATGQVEALRAECERLLHENSILRERNAALRRDAEFSAWTAHRIAKIAAKGATP